MDYQAHIEEYGGSTQDYSMEVQPKITVWRFNPKLPYSI